MTVEEVTETVESRKSAYITLLSEVVAIQSVSADVELRSNVVKMAEWLKSYFCTQVPNGTAEFVPCVGRQTLPNGDEIDLPPIVLATVGNDSNKKTLLIYAHYDVQPASLSDGWESDPWKLTVNEDTGVMRGRGSTDDKGPLIGWLCMIDAYVHAKQSLPLNLKFVFEGMEESGSIGFDETAIHISKTSDFFKGVDYCCISDNYWLGTKKPCLSYGLRGLTSVQVEISGPATDMHSGVIGGQVRQPLDDLISLLSRLKDAEDNILIPGVSDEVLPLTETERQLYESIDFSCAERAKQLGVSRLLYGDDKIKSLMAVWRYPALTIHGIEGAYSGPNIKTVIPCTVVGKFSIRLVPNQTGKYVEQKVQEYLETQFKALNSPYKMKLTMESGRWYYVDPTKSAVFACAAKAIQKVWKQEPDYTREGGAIPITLTIMELTGKEVCLLPMGRGDDGAHAQNEKLDVSNYIEGIKVFAHFLEELAVTNE